MRVLVTGSSGFLGQHIARHLADGANFEVTGYDLLPSPVDTIPSLQADLCDLAALRKASIGMDVVVHFGGIGDVDVATERPELAAQANVVGTTNVGIAAAEQGARVVYASTWEVYAPPVSDPVDESHPCGPGHIYGATKLGGEHVLRALHHHESLPVVILRLGTAYGTGMRPNSVFRRFADAGRAGEAIAVQGSGKQWRQFTHTSDIAKAVVLAANSGVTDATMNIVAGECVTINRLAELISHRYGTTVTFGPERHGDPPSARITSAAAANTLGWKAEVDFIMGLHEFLDDLDAGSMPGATERR
jgi:UDP-glucose 4-epimerase